MRRAVREALTKLEDVLIRGDKDASDLWDILSALRGPDVAELQGVKGVTTVVVRRTAFPRIAAEENRRGLMVDFHSCGTLTDTRRWVVGNPSREPHFTSHIRYALTAIEEVD